MPKGIDTHLDCTVSARGIKAAGYGFVGRYYRMPPPHSTKTPLKSAEAAALCNEGLWIASIWEYYSGANGRIDTLNYAAGKDEGERGYRQALAVPQPPGTPI